MFVIIYLLFSKPSNLDMLSTCLIVSPSLFFILLKTIIIFTVIAINSSCLLSVALKIYNSNCFNPPKALSECIVQNPGCPVFQAVSSVKAA